MFSLPGRGFHQRVTLISSVPMTLDDVIVHRVLKKYGVATTMRPHTTLRRLLVHPKDKVELEEQGELVYQIPCKNCGAEYIGETGRLLKTRLEEHRKDVDNTKKEKYTRSGKKRLMSTINKSALIDHATTENHIVDWEGVNIVDKEPNRRIRHIKEAIWIRKTTTPINRDEGNYELPHVYDDVIKRHRHRY